jgi:hypothetical protein
VGIKEFGAVCDASVLVDRESFERAQHLFDGGSLHLPSSTYSWLARDKLIGVRGKVIGYSLVSQFVRDGKLLVTFLPELYDEISRRLLFDVEREVPLTDLRASLLATHLKLPLLTFDDGLLERMRQHIGAHLLWQLDAHADWLAMREALELYRELASDVGSYLHSNIEGAETFENLSSELRRCRGENLQAVTEAMRRLSQARTNPGALSFKYIALDLMSVVRGYVEQHVLQPEVVRELCERTLLLVASPK